MSKDIMRGTVEDLEFGFTLNLEKTGGEPWDRISVTYNSEVGVLTVVVNDSYTWERPIEVPSRLKPQL
jgi:hypothetical protein